MMELARQYEAPMHAAFVDFSKAFDLVNHRVLWAVVRARGLAPKLVDLIHDLSFSAPFYSLQFMSLLGQPGSLL